VIFLIFRASYANSPPQTISKIPTRFSSQTAISPIAKPRAASALDSNIRFQWTAAMLSATLLLVAKSNLEAGIISPRIFCRNSQLLNALGYCRSIFSPAPQDVPPGGELIAPRFARATFLSPCSVILCSRSSAAANLDFFATRTICPANNSRPPAKSASFPD
jgi:hypothetical protein